jgi:hypothetical protein
MKRFLVVLTLLVGCDGGEGSNVLTDAGTGANTNTTTGTGLGTTTKTSTATHTATISSTSTTTYVVTTVISNPGSPTQTQTSVGTKDVTSIETVTVTTTSIGTDTSTVSCVGTGATQVCYTPYGVDANLGPNPCTNTKQHPECLSGCCGWNPTNNECFVLGGPGVVSPCSSNGVPAKVGELISSCDPAYAPRFRYRGDSTGGFVCLPCVEAIDGAACER